MSLWFKELPPGWEEAPLKSRLARNDGGVWGEDPDGGDSDTIVLRSTEQRVDGAWNIEAPAVRKLSTAEAEGGRLEVGDLVVTKSSGSELHIGKTSLVTTEVAALNACYSNFMQRLRVDGRTEPRFVHYWMNNELCREQFAYLSNSTSGLANLNGTVLGTALLAFPPKDKQERIANFLDEQTARIDALIAEKERLDGRLQEYRSSLISAAVTGQIDGENTDKAGVSQSWPTRRLRYVAELNPAVRPDLVAAQDTEVTFLPMDAIGEDGSLNLERVRPVAEVRNGYSYFEDGDVAFAKVTPCFENGKGALMRNLQFGAGFGTTELTVLRPKVGTCASFLRYVLQSENFRRNGAGAMTGAGGLKRVPDDFTRDFETPWPPHSEQERIAAFLDEQTNRIDALRHHVREHIERLREYRSSLISAAVTGQLDMSTAVSKSQ